MIQSSLIIKTVWHKHMAQAVWHKPPCSGEAVALLVRRALKPGTFQPRFLSSCAFLL